MVVWGRECKYIVSGFNRKYTVAYNLPDLTDWDRTNGIGPALLTIAHKRARLLMEENMSQSNTEIQSAILRGAYAEVTELINALKRAGVNECL